MLRLTFATGCEPGKWFSRFRSHTDHGELITIDSDDPLVDLVAGRTDIALARIPVGAGDPRLDDSYHLVHLYEETPGIAVPKDSVFAELGEPVPKGEVADEYVNYCIAADQPLDVAVIREGLQVVAANVGIVIAPRPLLKVLSKKQVAHLDYVDPDVARTQIALVWRKADDSDAIQDFVGIAKGRTANSSRQESPKKSARETAKAKQARRAAAGSKQPGKRPAAKGKDKNNGRVSSPLPKNKKRSGQRKRR